MRRRLLLATAGGVLSSAVSGCLGGGVGPLSLESGSESSPDQPPRYADLYGREFDGVIDYDDADHDEVPAYLEPSTGSIEAGEAIKFSLVNQHEEPLETNPLQWVLCKWDGEEWRVIQSAGGIFVSHSVLPGESYAWTLATESNDDVVDGEMARVERDTGQTGRQTGEEYTTTVTGLAGGHYAVGRTVRFGEGDSASWLALNTSVRVDAEPFDLTPTNDIETSWDGETLVVDADRGSGRDAAFVVEEVPAEQATDPREFTAEQLVQRGPKLRPVLRDAIALHAEHDPERVRVHQRNDQRPVFGIEDATHYEYGGTYYRATTEER